MKIEIYIIWTLYSSWKRHGLFI